MLLFQQGQSETVAVYQITVPFNQTLLISIILSRTKTKRQSGCYTLALSVLCTPSSTRVTALTVFCIFPLACINSTLSFLVKYYPAGTVYDENFLILYPFTKENICFKVNDPNLKNNWVWRKSIKLKSYWVDMRKK